MSIPNGPMRIPNASHASLLWLIGLPPGSQSASLLCSPPTCNAREDSPIDRTKLLAPCRQIAGSALIDSSNICRLNGPRFLCPSWVRKLAGAPSPLRSNGVLTRTPENGAWNGSCSSACAIMGARLNAMIRIIISILWVIPLPPALSWGVEASREYHGVQTTRVSQRCETVHL